MQNKQIECTREPVSKVAEKTDATERVPPKPSKNTRFCAGGPRSVVAAGTFASNSRVRIEWGGFTGYLDAGLFNYCWDGGLHIVNGKLLEGWQLQFKSNAHHFPREYRKSLAGATWRAQTESGLGGVLFDVEGDDNTHITIVTTAKTIEFKLGELRARKYMRWPVGAKYSGIAIAAMLDGAGPFEINGKVAAGCLDVRIPPASFQGAVRQGAVRQGAVRHQVFKTMEAAWVPPRQTVVANMNVPRKPELGTARRSYCVLECRLALASGYQTHYNEAGTQYSPVTINFNHRQLPAEPVYFRREHGSWKETQWIEFISIPVPAEWINQGRNRLEIRNDSRKLFLIVTGAQLRETIITNAEITAAPRWLVAGQKFDLELHCLRAHGPVRIKCRNAVSTTEITRLEPGRQRLIFTAGKKPEKAEIRIEAAGRELCRTSIPVYDVKPEKTPWLTGVMLEHVRLDESRQADHIIQYINDTQLGNYTQFRIEPTCTQRCNALAAKPEDWRRWGAMLKKYGIYFSVLSGHAWKGYKLDGHGDQAFPPAMTACRILKDVAGDFFFSTHVHEFTRSLYGCIPPKDLILKPADNTMTAAARRFHNAVNALEGIDGIPLQMGEAAPVAAADYAAGIEYVAVETMALHTLHLFAAASGAAKVFNKTWGIHNATYWCKAPDDFTKLALNYLNWYLTYMWGGRFVISEDGHFSIPHSHHQQQFHSEFPRLLRGQLREFNRFVHTNPRRGIRETPIAIAQGNGSCELIATPLKFANMRNCIGRVWGKFGAPTPEWKYGDPERGMELMDVFMPYKRDGYHIRHWFAGTPYGPFDLTPINDAPNEILAEYPLLAFLGWNTMTPVIYQKLKKYVKQGGTLFCAIPHFSRHTGRKFLLKMNDLKLYNNGDLSDLCGVKIKGATEPGQFTAKWIPTGYPPGFQRHQHTQYQCGDKKAPMRLAEMQLAGARPLITDTVTGQPLMIENRLGRGRVWLMTTWAYPGNANCMAMAHDALHLLAEHNRKKVSAWIEDPSREIAYTCRHAGRTRILHLLNTDWTEAGNEKPCLIHIGKHVLPVKVRERNMRTLTWHRQLAILPDDNGVHVEKIEQNGRGKNEYSIIIQGHGTVNLEFFGMGGHVRALQADNRPVKMNIDQRGHAGCRVDFGRRTRMELSVALKMKS